MCMSTVHSTHCVEYGIGIQSLVPIGQWMCAIPSFDSEALRFYPGSQCTSVYCSHLSSVPGSLPDPPAMRAAALAFAAPLCATMMVYILIPLQKMIQIKIDLSNE